MTKADWIALIITIGVGGILMGLIAFFGIMNERYKP